MRRRRDSRKWVIGTDEEFRKAFWECRALLKESEDEIDNLIALHRKIKELRKEYLTLLSEL